MVTAQRGGRRETVVRSGVAAALIAILFLFVLGRGPGSLTWLAGAPPIWLPFAGSGFEWLPFDVSWLPFAGSDAPAPRPSAAPVAVATPTAAPTPEPAPSPTPTPVAVSTPVPAPAATPPPAATPRPAPKPTPTPTAPPAPPAPLPTSNPVLFSDTFEGDALNGQPAGWSTAGNFSIQQDGSHVLYTGDSTWAVATVGSGGWVNYVVKGSVKAASTTGHSRLIARYQAGAGYYACGLDHGGHLYLGRVDGASWTDLAMPAYAFNPDRFYSASLKVSGSALTCSVTDPTGALAPLSATVTDATYAGGAAGWVGEGPGELDNFSVSSI